jgi:hypothetical protein
MKHYDQAHWLQFLRAELDPQLRSAMQRHLDAPCSKCSATVELLRKVASTAQADAQVNVPESAVRMARAIFALNKPEEVHLKSGILARLVFDSFREPATAGVRSGRQLARQTLYEAGDYTIDLRFEPDLDPAQVVMVGQIANRVAPELPPQSVPIVLRGGRQELGRAVTNQFGEFQLVYRPKMPLRLLVSVLRGTSDRVEIRVPGSPQKGPSQKASSRQTAAGTRKAHPTARRKSHPGTEKF